MSSIVFNRFLSNIRQQDQQRNMHQHLLIFRLGVGRSIRQLAAAAACHAVRQFATTAAAHAVRDFAADAAAHRISHLRKQVKLTFFHKIAVAQRAY